MILKVVFLAHKYNWPGLVRGIVTVETMSIYYTIMINEQEELTITMSSC